MKDKALVPTVVVLVVALVALITTFAVTRGDGGIRHLAVPSHEIVNQEVVKAPPLADSGAAGGAAAAARSSTVMGGPPAGSHGQP